MPQERTIQSFMQWLRSDDVSVRNMAHKGLVAVGDPAVDILIELLEEEVYPVSPCAALILGDIGDQRATPSLIAALGSSHMLVRQSAIEALGNLGDQAAVQSLLAALSTETDFIKIWIVTALGKLGDPAAVPPLIDLLQTVEVSSLRYSIIKALGDLGEPSAIEPILAFKSDDNQHVRDNVEKALIKLQMFR